VLYILLCGAPPFEGKCTDIVRDVKEGQYTFKYSVWNDIGMVAKDLVSKMLRKDPNKRPSAEQVLAHMWFTQLNDSSNNNILSTQDLKGTLKRLKTYRTESRFQ
jgi:serine/threonine protein kinase